MAKLQFCILVIKTLLFSFENTPLGNRPYTSAWEDIFATIN